MDRAQMIALLLTQEEQSNNDYIMGNMDRDTWTKTLQGIDDRLAVIGVRLTSRPWEERATATRF